MTTPIPLHTDLTLEGERCRVVGYVPRRGAPHLADQYELLCTSGPVRIQRVPAREVHDALAQTRKNGGSQ